MEAAALPRERAAAALDELRALLGPDSVAADGSDADTSTLEQLVDDGLAELRQMLPGYSGPEAAKVAELALELADIRVVLAEQRTTRRVDGVLQVQRAL